ncbi:MAG: hypothetical protein WEB60_14375, partial [Terrimicrobiaceae bacterium]
AGEGRFSNDDPWHPTSYPKLSGAQCYNFVIFHAATADFFPLHHTQASKWGASCIADHHQFQ